MPLLNVNGELYGNLIAPDGSQDKRLLRIPYGDAKARQVKYIANGEVPFDWADPPIQVEAQLSDDPGVDGIGTLQIQPLHHFEVTVAEDTIAHGDTVNIAVQPKNANNENINLADDELVDFSLDANGEQYGSLLNPTGELKKSLNEVAFGDVKSGKVKFVANGENTIECDPKMFTVSATLNNNSG